MMKLNKNYRQIIRLVYFEEMTVKQAALIMHKRTHAAEMLFAHCTADFINNFPLNENYGYFFFLYNE